MATALGDGVHRGRRRPRLRRRGPGDLLREEEPAGAVGERGVAAAVRHAAGRRRAPRATARHGGRTQRRLASRHRRAADRRAVGRPRVRLAGVRRGQQQRDRLRQGSPGVRHRRRPAEPARLGPHRGRALRRPCGRWRVRERRVLPVPRRPRRCRSGRHRRGDPAGRSASATTRSSPPPTSTASPWSSPANATSATDPSHQRRDRVRPRSRRNATGQAGCGFFGGAEVVRPLGALGCEEHDQDDGTDERDQGEQEEPARLVRVVQASDPDGEARDDRGEPVPEVQDEEDRRRSPSGSRARRRRGSSPGRTTRTRLDRRVRRTSHNAGVPLSSRCRSSACDCPLLSRPEWACRGRYTGAPAIWATLVSGQSGGLAVDSLGGWPGSRRCWRTDARCRSSSSRPRRPART